MEKKIEEFTDIELKAGAYDTIVQIQLLQQQLQMINNELGKRTSNLLQFKTN